MNSITEGLFIRSAIPDDAEACYRVHRTAALEGFAHIFPRELYPFPEQEMRERWMRLAQDQNVLVAEIKNKLVATAGFDDTDFISFFVLPEYWGSGVAAALYQAVVDQVRTRGDDAFFLWVLEENYRARRFYERRGWLPTGNTRRTPFPPRPTLLQYRIDLMNEHE